MNLILLERHEVIAGDEAVLTGPRAAHLQQVLKAAPGRTVHVGIVDGPRGTGTVSSSESGVVRLACVFDEAVPPAPSVDLLLALPRPKVMRRLWAQLAALGVGRIMLTNAARVERHYFDTHVLQPACYRPLLLEGLQQARDTRVPAVSIHRQLRVLVEDELDALAGGRQRLIADPDAAASVPAALSGRRAAGGVLLAIGPEGGWNAFERRLLEAHAFVPVGMGSRTLRSDTACVALLSLVHHALAERETAPHRPNRST